MTRNFLVKQTEAGQRLDLYVTKMLKPSNRSYVQKLCEDGLVLVNSQPAKPSYKIHAGDTLTVNKPPAVSLQKLEMPVIYQDENCLVINKPSGILTHSKGAFNPEPTVASFIAPLLQGMSGERAGIVHRLDRGTSGVIICAKNADTLSFFQKQFASRKVKKHYIAIVSGELKEPTALIDMPIERNPKRPQSFRVGPNGKPAKTKYTTLSAFSKGSKLFSMVEFEPLTGRTHQLRVHMAYVGHPIVGDHVYGKAPASRLMLHAAKLEITLPGGRRQVFTSPLPQEFSQFIESNDEK